MPLGILFYLLSSLLCILQMLRTVGLSMFPHLNITPPWPRFHSKKIRYFFASPHNFTRAHRIFLKVTYLCITVGSFLKHLLCLVLSYRSPILQLSHCDLQQNTVFVYSFILERSVAGSKYKLLLNVSRFLSLAIVIVIAPRKDKEIKKLYQTRLSLSLNWTVCQNCKQT